ncbi:MAG: choline monooxygenase [Thermoleophilaceae bacterium]|jgi:Rieske 2Fe-2S family protein|nr:choline monooxygenase [Thermoleophilaceae bacterium]MEA2455263.1 choline monooxygenase [Thermoleophilaceae bacterium]
MRLITKSGTRVATIESPPQTPRALPARLYRDPEIVELEHRRIFERNWQFAAHVSRLPNPGSYLTATAGRQPVLVLRDHDGTLRAFRNVCRHRGSRLLAGSGECGKAIRCRYHGWTYKLDGELIGVPEARSIPDLDKSALGLFPVRVETLAGLVFVNLDMHARPLAEHVPGLAERLAEYGLEDLVPGRPLDGGQPANWKIVADNYLEGYHVPIAHPGLMRLYDYKSYSVDLHDGYAWFDAPLRDKPSGNLMERAYQRLVSPMPGLPDEYRRLWRYIYIYPNTAIDLYPDQVWVWKLDSDGPLRTADTAMLYRHPDASVRTRLAQFFNRKVNELVGEEDADLVANVQAGLESRGWEPGPLAGAEAAVGWFADKIRADLGDEA